MYISKRMQFKASHVTASDASRLEVCILHRHMTPRLQDVFRAEKNETSLSHKCTEAQRVEVRDNQLLSWGWRPGLPACACLSFQVYMPCSPEWEQAVLGWQGERQCL